MIDGVEKLLRKVHRSEKENDPAKLVKKIDKILDSYFWLPTLAAPESFKTTHDDNDGDPSSGFLTVTIGMDGDLWIKTHGPALRFRMPMSGGGKFHRIRNALLILAHAIKKEGSMGDAE